MRRIRSNFNAQVKQLVKDKGAEMDRVEEKNVRLLEIIAELNVRCAEGLEFRLWGEECVPH